MKTFFSVIFLFVLSLPIALLLKKLQPLLNVKKPQPQPPKREPTIKTRTKIYYVTDKSIKPKRGVDGEIALEKAVYHPDEFRRIEKD